MRAIRSVGLVIVVALASHACSGDGGAHKRTTTAEGLAGTDRPRVASDTGEIRVTLSEQAYQTAGIQVEVVGQGGSAVEMQVPGHVEFDRSRVALISPRTSGRIERMAVVEGDRVRAGAPAAFLLSPAFLTAQAEFQRAVQRAERLADTPDAGGARALAEAARRRLRLLGVADAEIARLEAGGEPADLLVLPAPFGGSIVEVQGVAGASVEPGTPIATIADLSVVTVLAEVPEGALPAVRRGMPASVNVAALPGAPVQGRIERIHDEIDPATRTVKVVIRVPNPDHALKAGMFATVRLQLGATDISSHRTPGTGDLTIPESAVVTEGEARYVFVQTGSRTFERRTIEVPTGVAGAVTPGRVVVRRGIAAGERVVVRGAFVLKSELGKAGFAEPEG
jgi:RND family efflux transporter MFP subunit